MAKKGTQSRAAALRARLEGQKKGMSSGGRIISNKEFSKMTLRVVPIVDVEETPGVEYWSLFSKKIGKKGNGTTSPRTFGLPCPVMDYLDKVYNEGDKEDRELVKSTVNVNREYWMGVWDRKEMGTPGDRSIKVLRAKRTVYEQIVNYMLDTEEEDEVADVTDPVTGRDIRVRKTGSGLDTEWTVKVLDKGSISDDEDELQAFVDEAKVFDVTRFFYKIDLEVLEEMYQLLTGEEIPEKYLSKIEEFCTSKSDDDDDDDDGDDDGDEDKEPDSDDAEDSGDNEPEADDEVEFGEARGQFENDGTTVEGTITGRKEDDEGDDCYLILEDGDDEPWYVQVANVTLVEPEEEPEEVPPAVTKKPSAKKPSAKKPAASKDKSKVDSKKTSSKKTGAKPKTSSLMRKRLGKSKAK